MNNLNNLSDDELDKLFRQSAEESDVEFDEGAWQKMNSLLDEKQPLPTNWRKYSLIILAILFLGSTALYFGNENGLFNSFKNGQNTITKNDGNVEKSAGNNDELKTPESGINENTGSETEKNTDISTENENKITQNESLDKSGTKQLENNKSESEGIEIDKLKNGLSKRNSLENGKLSTQKLTNISEKQDKSIAEKSKINSNPNTENFTGKNKIVNKPNPNNSLEIDEVAKSNNLESSFSVENSKAKKRNKLDKKPTEKIFAKADNKKEKAVDENTNEIENKDIFTENNNSENIKNNNLKSKKTNQNASILESKIYAKNLILSKNKVDNKSDNLSDNQLFENSNQIADLPVEKTYLQNIRLQYLLPNSNFKYKKPIFEVEVNPLELDLPIPQKVEFYKKGLAIRLAISPDISTISSNKISKIGNNIGGLLEYRFSNKWSVQAGVFRSMKYYDAMPDQYTWIWGYSHDKLVDINATCKMVDFPINIRYDFLAKGSTRIFVGAGATTYKMMNEKYHYNYVDNYSPTVKHRDWSGKTGTYYTSNLNLSVGLEKYISKNFTIQVEPFVKSPLKSIGFGKVPLITYGMMISGKYPLNNLIKK
jgi:Outer membrane protein beta-barrel domain